MNRTARLWAEIFGLSWRRTPGLTLTAVGLLLGRVVAMAGSALALRAAVDATTRHQVGPAVIAAVAAAVGYSLLIVVQNSTAGLILTIADQVGRLDLHPQIHRDLATIEGLDHLERPEYLDRLDLVHKAGGRLATGMWNAVKTVTSVLSLTATLLLLGRISAWLLLLLVFAAVPIWLDHYGQRAVRRANLATAEPYRLQQHLFALAVSSAGGKELRVSGAGRAVAARQAETWQLAMRARQRAQFVAAGWSLLGWTVFVAGFAGGLALATYRTTRGQSTPGDLVLLVTVAATLRASVQSTVESTARTASTRQYLAPFLWLRDYAEQARATPTGRRRPPAVLREGLTLDHVSYRYPGTDRLVLDDVSIHLPAGSVVAIVGEYGSGKTTLVKLLCKFYQPDSGRITVDGTDLADLATEAWRARSTAAFQDFGRFHTTLAENVGLGDLPDIADEERLRAALAEADAAELTDRLPDGLHTLLGQELGGIELSEGQWQRAALARASMRKDPLLLILDEPTASLDAPSEQAIFQRYMTRAHDLATRTGAVTVIVSHRFSTVAGADLVLVLDRGRLAEHGSHPQLLALGGHYAELYGIQAHAYRTADPP